MLMTPMLRTNSTAFNYGPFLTKRLLNVTGIISMLAVVAYLVAMLFHKHVGVLDSVVVVLTSPMVGVIVQVILLAMWWALGAVRTAYRFVRA